MSCDIEYLQRQFLFFLERWSSSFCIVCNCFEDFRTNFPKIIGQFHRKENTNFPKRRWVRYNNVCLSSALLFPLVVAEKKFWELLEISLLGTVRVFCSNAESSFGCASSRRLSLVLWLFRSWVWAGLQYRILRKTALDFFGRNVVFVILYCVQLFWWFSYKPSESYWAISTKRKHKLSETTLSTFQKWLFELCWACFFGCN